MIVIMEEVSDKKQVAVVESAIKKHGYKSNSIRFSSESIGTFPETGENAETLKELPGVKKVIEKEQNNRLARRETRQEDTIVQVGEEKIGDGNLTVIAGPCAVESEDQTMRIAEEVLESGAQILRGGAYKPRTSPYSFQGLGERGLAILAKVRDKTGLPIVTEALDPMTAPTVAEYSDMIQIGARNMQNFSLLETVGKLGKPVILKRGMSANLEEVLLAAEYIMSNGCSEVVVCERGIRTFSDHSRNTLDLGLIPVFKRVSHLPIIVDPSHASGVRENVLPLAYAALGVGADGIMVDVHDEPQKARVDGDQAILPAEFEQMMHHLRTLGNSIDIVVGCH
ncbi:MAG: Phospho-2-dehydro-3-deoxyheptonate aldolase [Candidatus Marinimicrobia bacterium]|nr:Phospho-2-dehydro-3-deoxyheptonate aldolase [Candidatus Neomarinimicrobiota bacterium]